MNRALLLALLLLPACSPLRGLETPRVSLVNLQFQNITVFETSAVVEVRVSNPNPEPIAINGASYGLLIGGTHVGEAMSPDRLEVPALGSVVQRAEVHLSNLALARNIKSIVESKHFHYAITSRLYLKTSKGEGKVKSFNEGVIDAKDFTPNTTERRVTE